MIILKRIAPIVQWIECSPAKAEIVGSTPAGRTEI